MVSIAAATVRVSSSPLPSASTPSIVVLREFVSTEYIPAPTWSLAAESFPTSPFTKFLTMAPESLSSVELSL